MFIFGHLGIGSAVLRPISRGLPKWSILLGAILPDLIDKSLFYGLKFFTSIFPQTLSPEILQKVSIISGTRTFGHTLLFFAALIGLSGLTKSRIWIGVALGDCSHLLLDGVSTALIGQQKMIMGQHKKELSDFMEILFWPFYKREFAPYTYSNMVEHLSTFFNPVILWSEVIGALFLFKSYFILLLRKLIRRKNKEN